MPSTNPWLSGCVFTDNIVGRAGCSNPWQIPTQTNRVNNKGSEGAKTTPNRVPVKLHATFFFYLSTIRIPTLPFSFLLIFFSTILPTSPEPLPLLFQIVRTWNPRIEKWDHNVDIQTMQKLILLQWMQIAAKTGCKITSRERISLLPSIVRSKKENLS